MKASLSIWERARSYFRLSLKKKREGHLKLGRQLAEMTILQALRGIGPGYYHLAGFWRASIPWRDKWRHLNGREYIRLVRKINPPSFHKLSQNKLAEKGILTLLGFPTPEFLGFLCREGGRTSSGLPLRTPSDLRRLLKEQAARKVCFKPIEGWAGRGFRAAELRLEGASLSLVDLHRDRVIPLEECFSAFLELNEGRQYLIEEYLEQHPTLRSFNPSSVNTLRLWTVSYSRSETRVVVGYLRIGRAGSLVDNQSSGGIVAPIDLERGVLRTAIDGSPERETYDVHPDHGAPIVGMRIPYFEEAQQLSVAVLDSFPQVRFAGLDIAIGKDGPVILELNVSPDMQGAAFVDMPTQLIFSNI